MELETLFPAAPFLIYVLIDRLKVHLPQRHHKRMIPDISAGIGLTLAAVGLYVGGPYDYSEWALGLAAGILAGYSATGIHQGRKQREV